MVYVAPVWQGKCCRRCNHLVFQDECLNCTDRCFNLSSEDYIQYVWEISRSFHSLFFLIIAFFCWVSLFTFLQHNEHPSIHPFSIPAPSGSFTVFFPLANNAHLFLIEFLWEYITVTVFTPACPPWIGFVCICIPHFEGWAHELLRRLHGHEIKKKKRVSEDPVWRASSFPFLRSSTQKQVGDEEISHWSTWRFSFFSCLLLL